MNLDNSPSAYYSFDYSSENLLRILHSLQRMKYNDSALNAIHSFFTHWEVLGATSSMNACISLFARESDAWLVESRLFVLAVLSITKPYPQLPVRPFFVQRIKRLYKRTWPLLEESYWKGII